MKKRKRRSVAVSSAASRKGWRTRKLMNWERQIYAMADEDGIIRPKLRTIDRLPKVKWP